MNLKKFEGKKIWLIGTGDNKKLWTNGYIHAVVEKVGRVNVTLRMCGGTAKKFRLFHENVLNDGSSRGYLAYETEQEVKDVLESERLINLIIVAAQPEHLKKLNVRQLREIAKVVGQ